MVQSRVPDLFSSGDCGSTIAVKILRTLAMQRYETGAAVLERIVETPFVRKGFTLAGDGALSSDLRDFLQGTDPQFEYNHVRLADLALQRIGRPRAWPLSKLLIDRAYRAGDYAAARSAVEEALRAAGEDPAAEVLLHCSDVLGRIYSDQGDFESAVQCWSEAAEVAAAAKLDREEWDQRVGLIWCYQSLGQPLEALREIDAAETIAVRMQDCDALAKTLLDRGNTLLAPGTLTEARRALEGALWAARAAANAERQSDALGNLGSIAMHEDRLADAEAYHRLSLEISLTFADKQSAQFDFNNLAQTLWKQGRSEEALELEKRALALAQERGDQENTARYSASAHRMGEALGKPKDAKPASEPTKRFIPGGPQESPTRQAPRPADDVEKEVRSLLTQGRAEEAEHFLEQEIARNPENAGARAIYSVVLARKGDGEGAVKQVETAVRLAPDDVSVHFRRVDIYAGQNRFDELEALYKSAIADDPFRATLRVGLALIYTRTGRMDEGAQQAQEAVNLAPEEPFPLRALAEAQFGAAMALVQADWDAAWSAFQDCATTLQHLAFQFVNPHGEWHFYAARCMEQFAMRSYEANPPMMGGMDIQELQLLGWAMKHYTLAGEQDAGRSIDRDRNRVDAVLRTLGRPQSLVDVAREFRAQNDLSIALPMLVLSLQMQPEQGAAYNELALLMEGMGDLKEARNYIRQALDYSPENEEYQETLRRLKHPRVEHPKLAEGRPSGLKGS